jgi:hypothetical protein
MKNYTTVLADFVELVNAKQPDGSMLATNKVCKKEFVEVIKHTSEKVLEGSSMRVIKGIKVKAFANISCFIKPNMNMVINNVGYGNLEVTPIVGTKVYVQIEAWA